MVEKAGSLTIWHLACQKHLIFFDVEDISSEEIVMPDPKQTKALHHG